MVQIQIMPGAESLYFHGSQTGVLLSHGFTGTTQSMHFFGQYLHQYGGYTVLCPRLSGHGTTPQEMACASAEGWIRDIEASLDRLHQNCTRVFIGGLSMGGTLSLYMSAMHPDLVAGALPVNAAVFLDNTELASLAFNAGALDTIPGVGSDIKKQGEIELVYPVVPVPAIRQLYVLMAVTRELLPKVTCPVLVFSSTEDHVVPPGNGPYIMEHLGSQHKRLLWLDNSYHVATLDNQKELIAQEALKFISAN